MCGCAHARADCSSLPLLPGRSKTSFMYAFCARLRLCSRVRALYPCRPNNEDRPVNEKRPNVQRCAF